jgi:hypothetical protein
MCVVLLDHGKKAKQVGNDDDTGKAAAAGSLGLAKVRGTWGCRAQAAWRGGGQVEEDGEDNAAARPGLEENVAKASNVVVC